MGIIFSFSIPDLQTGHTRTWFGCYNQTERHIQQYRWPHCVTTGSFATSKQTLHSKKFSFYSSYFLLLISECESLSFIGSLSWKIAGYSTTSRVDKSLNRSLRIESDELWSEDEQNISSTVRWFYSSMQSINSGISSSTSCRFASAIIVLSLIFK